MAAITYRRWPVASFPFRQAHDGRAGVDLRRFPLVSALVESQIRALDTCVRIREVKRRARIYGPGDPSGEILLLKAGVVKIAAIAAGNREVILRFVYAGDVFGELAAIDDCPRDHLAIAHEDCVVCCVARSVFRQAARQSAKFAGELSRLLATRIRQAHARLHSMACRTAQARVVCALLNLANGHGIVDDARGVRVPLRLSQRDLANLAGVTRETVNIVLRELRGRGLIETDRYGFRLIDQGALRCDLR